MSETTTTYTITRYTDGAVIAASIPGTFAALDAAGVPIDVQGSLGYGHMRMTYCVWADDTYTETEGRVITLDR